MELQKQRETTGRWLANPKGSAAGTPAPQAGVGLPSEEQRLPVCLRPFAAVVQTRRRLKS